MNDDLVILVDADDRAIGTCPKLEAHRPPGRLHRAFSVFVDDGAGRLLLQQRSFAKYHFGGRWTNTCCSHPRPGEGVEDAARRRLGEEMGLLSVTLTSVGTFQYWSEDAASGLVEHELDHVFVGMCTDEPSPDPSEVAAFEWVRPSDVLARLRRDPQQFTPWFEAAFTLSLATMDLAGASVEAH